MKSLKKKMAMDDRLAKLPQIELIRAIGWILSNPDKMVLSSEVDDKFGSFIRFDLIKHSLVVVTSKQNLLVSSVGKAAWDEAMKLPSIKKQLIG